MLVEDERNKPQRKMDYILGIDRTQKFLSAVNTQRDKERELYDSLARNLKPLVIEKAKQKTEKGRQAILTEKRSLEAGTGLESDN